MCSQCHVLRLRWVCGERPTARDHCWQQRTDNKGVSASKRELETLPSPKRQLNESFLSLNRSIINPFAAKSITYI